MIVKAPRPFNPLAMMTVTVPEGKSGEFAVERFEITDAQVRRAAIRDGGRAYTPPGTYTKLSQGSRLWMSDTHAERHDHDDIVRAMKQAGDGAKILITGLGLGMVLNAALQLDNIARIDVIEKERDVIDLVGPHYIEKSKTTGIHLNIFHADAYGKPAELERGMRWDIAYHDIWENISGDNWDEMKRLKRVYNRVVGYQDCWLADECQRLYKKDLAEENERRKRQEYLKSRATAAE